MAPRYELAVGMRRGHKTTKIERVGKVSGKELSAKSEKLRQARTKGVSSIVCCIFLTVDSTSILDESQKVFFSSIIHG